MRIICWFKDICFRCHKPLIKIRWGYWRGGSEMYEPPDWRVVSFKICLECQPRYKVQGYSPVPDKARNRDEYLLCCREAKEGRI